MSWSLQKKKAALEKDTLGFGMQYIKVPKGINIEKDLKPETYSAGCIVSRQKTLIVDGTVTVTAIGNEVGVRSMFLINGSDTRLDIQGSGSLTFKANTNASANAVVDVDNAHTRESEDGAQEEESEAEDYEAFLNEFFKETNRSNIEVICMQLHTTPEALRKEAEEVVAEWRLTKARHQDYSDKARHLVNQLRVRYNLKLKEDGRKQKQPADTAAAKDRFNGVCETPKKKKHLRSTI